MGFKFTHPVDGRTVVIKGNIKPTGEQLKEIFAGLPPKKSTPPPQAPPQAQTPPQVAQTPPPQETPQEGAFFEDAEDQYAYDAMNSRTPEQIRDMAMDVETGVAPPAPQVEQAPQSQVETLDPQMQMGVGMIEDYQQEQALKNPPKFRSEQEVIADANDEMKRAVKFFADEYIGKTNLDKLLDPKKVYGDSGYTDRANKTLKILSNKIDKIDKKESRTEEENKERIKLNKQRNQVTKVISMMESKLGPDGQLIPSRPGKGNSAIDNAMTSGRQERLAEETTGTKAQAFFPSLSQAIRDDEGFASEAVSAISDIGRIPGNVVAGWISSGDLWGEKLFQHMGIKPSDKRTRDRIIGEIGNALNYVAPSGSSTIGGFKGTVSKYSLASQANRIPRPNFVTKSLNKPIPGESSLFDTGVRKGSNLFDDKVTSLVTEGGSKGLKGAIKLGQKGAGLAYDKVKDIGIKLAEAGVKTQYEQAPETIVRSIEYLTDKDDRKGELLLELVAQTVLGVPFGMKGKFAKQSTSEASRIQKLYDSDDYNMPIDIQKQLEDTGFSIKQQSSQDTMQGDEIIELAKLMKGIYSKKRFKELNRVMGGTEADVTDLIKTLESRMEAKLGGGQYQQQYNTVKKELKSLKALVKVRGRTTADFKIGEKQINDTGLMEDVVVTSDLSTARTAAKAKEDVKWELDLEKESLATIKSNSIKINKLTEELETASSKGKSNAIKGKIEALNRKSDDIRARLEKSELDKAPIEQAKLDKEELDIVKAENAATKNERLSVEKAEKEAAAQAKIDKAKSDKEKLNAFRGEKAKTEIAKAEKELSDINLESFPKKVKADKKKTKADKKKTKVDKDAPKEKDEPLYDDKAFESKQAEIKKKLDSKIASEEKRIKSVLEAEQKEIQKQIKEAEDAAAKKIRDDEASAEAIIMEKEKAINEILGGEKKLIKQYEKDMLALETNKANIENLEYKLSVENQRVTAAQYEAQLKLDKQVKEATLGEIKEGGENAAEVIAKKAGNIGKLEKRMDDLTPDIVEGSERYYLPMKDYNEKYGQVGDITFDQKTTSVKDSDKSKGLARYVYGLMKENLTKGKTPDDAKIIEQMMNELATFNRDIAPLFSVKGSIDKGVDTIEKRLNKFVNGGKSDEVMAVLAEFSEAYKSNRKIIFADQTKGMDRKSGAWKIANKKYKKDIKRMDVFGNAELNQLRSKLQTILDGKKFDKTQVPSLKIAAINKAVFNAQGVLGTLGKVFLKTLRASVKGSTQSLTKHPEQTLDAWQSVLDKLDAYESGEETDPFNKSLNYVDEEVVSPINDVVDDVKEGFETGVDYAKQGIKGAEKLGLLTPKAKKLSNYTKSRGVNFKSEVSFDNAKPIIKTIISEIAPAFKSAGIASKPLITSITDSAPGRLVDSRHPKGTAIDFSVKGMTTEQENKLLTHLQKKHKAFIHDVKTGRHLHVSHK